VKKMQNFHFLKALNVNVHDLKVVIKMSEKDLKEYSNLKRQLPYFMRSLARSGVDIEVLSALCRSKGKVLGIFYINKIQSASGCQKLVVFQTAGPISVKFCRKAQLNHVGKIAIVLYL